VQRREEGIDTSEEATASPHPCPFDDPQRVSLQRGDLGILDTGEARNWIVIFEITGNLLVGRAADTKDREVVRNIGVVTGDMIGVKVLPISGILYINPDVLSALQKKTKEV
jgi:hypothetical protein